MTNEWRGDRPLPIEPNAITQQYPPDFLGDTRDIASATKLRLRYGNTAQIELHLRSVTYYPVYIPVTPDATAAGVSVRVTGADSAFTGFGLDYSPRDHAVTGSLPSGGYNLLLSGFGQAPTFGITSVHIAATPLRASVVTMHPAGAIAVRIRREFSSQQAPNFANVFLNLRPDTQGTPFAVASNRPDQAEEFAIPNAQPGRYFTQANTSWGYVASIMSGGHDLQREPLIVNSNGAAEPIDVTLRDDTATLTGTVALEGQVATHTYIVAVTLGVGPQQVVAYAGADGKFSLAGLPPGSSTRRAILHKTPSSRFMAKAIPAARERSLASARSR